VSSFSGEHYKSFLTALSHFLSEVLRAIAIKPRFAGLVARTRPTIPRAGHLLGHVQKKLAIRFLSFSQQATSVLRKRPSLPELPQAVSSEDFRLGRLGSLGGSSPS
jgi:hypothetical protein